MNTKIRIKGYVFVSAICAALFSAGTLANYVICPPVDGGYTNTIYCDKNPCNGTKGNDIIVGTDAGETINGGFGHDCILGGGGDDTLNGGMGSDYLNGEDGDDTLNGGWCDDTLNGGDDYDKCYGGQGDDSDGTCEEWFDGGSRTHGRIPGNAGCPSPNGT